MVLSGHGGCRDPSHTRRHPLLAGLCAGIWTLTPRALQGHTTHWCGVAPLQFCLALLPFPHPTPDCAGTQLPWGGRAPCFCWRHAPSRLAHSTAAYFSTRGRTKISLSHPSSAAATAITPARPLFPRPSAVTAFKPRRLQLPFL